MPVTYRTRSVMVVLPASTWARMPRLRTPLRGLAETRCRPVRTAQGPFEVIRAIGTARLPRENRLADARNEPGTPAGRPGRRARGTEVLASLSGGRAAGAGRPESPE